MFTRTLKALFSSNRVKPNKKLQVPFKVWQILKGDEVQMRSGVDRGKIGKVLRVFRKANKVIVDGVNLRYSRSRTEADTTVTKKKPAKVHVSTVGLYDNVAKRAVRIKYGYHPETYQKLRISRKTGIIIPKPVNYIKKQERGKNRKKGVKDTSAQTAHKVTYQGQDFEKVKKQFDAFIAQKERREKNLVFTF